ncbi:MAG: DUF488 family protein [Polaromonas sp.]|uniref:DUF488 domain-containing protein n=1 Tax=Polaromonas sp. TaxID=1869339 RepID=UPI002719AAB6|nr:DUF488 family protein [Polaromonas sp.]MDO9114067.1 DUF488 family protein [Polaromonas sp.]MDP1885801.1 DUF488 family protein [Polaromonas sp.]
MGVSIVRLGTARQAGEGLRIGTVRRPPRGVPKSEFATQDWYDVWYPNLAPSAATMKLGQSVETDKDWAAFSKKYRAEMNEPDASRNLDLLAALSHQTNFAMGCYCENEARCHRSLLRDLLQERGADLAPTVAHCV